MPSSEKSYRRSYVTYRCRALRTSTDWLDSHAFGGPIKTLHEATTIAESIRRTWIDPRLCATFEVAEHPHRWVQYGDRRINACYPTERHPAALLTVLGGELHSWDSQRYITVDLQLNDADRVAEWITRYFQWVLSSAPDGALHLRIGRFSCGLVAAAATATLLDINAG